jgi:ABC-type multidrug transport system permease subunit
MLQNTASYPSERDVFSREHTDNIYNVSTFMLTYTILEISFEIASSLFFGALLAFATNLDRSPIFFLIAALNCFCVLSCGESVGIVFCTLFSHTGFALNITSVVLTIATIMAGVISLDVPRWLQAFNYLSPLKYEVANMAVYLMRGRKFTCAVEQMVEGVCPLSTGEEVLKLYRLDKDSGLNLMAFGITTVVYRLIAWGVLLVVYGRRKHTG